jgi:TP53 regulating kinase-like protein
MSDQVRDVAVQIGEAIAIMHDNRLIHGDLTTSNLMLLPPKKDEKLKLAVIDFGLGSFDHKEETKAVDLYVVCSSISHSYHKHTHTHTHTDTFWNERSTVHIRIRKPFSK